MKIIHERDKCIGCGSCVMICPKYWKMEESGKAHLIGSKLDKKTQVETLEVQKTECNREAIDVCPVQCIRIKS